MCFDSKNYRQQNILKETKSHFFVCLATAALISISVSPNKGSRFIIKKKSIKVTQTKPETTQDCLKEQRRKLVKVTFSFQIFCPRIFSPNCLLDSKSDKLNQPR